MWAVGLGAALAPIVTLDKAADSPTGSGAAVKAGAWAGQEVGAGGDTDEGLQTTDAALEPGFALACLLQESDGCAAGVGGETGPLSPEFASVLLRSAAAACCLPVLGKG